MTYYVIDTRTNKIVNAIEVDHPIDMTKLVDQMNFEEPEFIRLDTDPPRAMLEAYQYWNERP